MKRLMMFLVVGMLAVSTASYAQIVRDTILENDGLGRSISPYAIQSIPEATSGFRLPVNTITTYGNRFNQWDDIYCTSYIPPGAYHPGVDLNSAGSCDDDRGTDILAVANGRVVYVDVSDWGGIVIQHNWKGETWYSQYGHINTPLVAVGNDVTKGQHIAEMSDVGTTCVHLHWEIREADHPNPTVGDYWICSVLRNSGSVANYYEDPEAFVASHGAYTTTPDYMAVKTGQNVSTTPWLPAGGSYTLWVDYRNEGTVTWKNSGPVSGGYVELRSVDGSCTLYSSFCAYDAATWINRQGIGPAQQASVPNGSLARFQFVARAASTTGTCVQWVAPWANGQCMDGWGGVNFTIQTDATIPQGALAGGTPQPGTYASDITIGFVVNDSHSGGRGYTVGWDNPSIGGPEVGGTSGSTTLAAQGAGSHTLYLRVWDQVGNTTVSNLGVYTYQTGPCGTRQITGCTNPPHPIIPPASAQSNSKQ